MRKLLGLTILFGAVCLGSACSGSSDNGDGSDAGLIGDSPCTLGCGDVDSGKDSGADAQIACDYPADAGNDPRCPATYSTAHAYQICPQVGLTCGYPGRGDGESNGCFATAVLICNDPDAGLGGGVDAAIFDDAGDSGVGYWTFAQ